MIRVPKDKSIDIFVPYRMYNDTGLLVTEDAVWVHADETLYNRIKSSYDSGKIKSMNDDESLKDLCEEYAANARKARWQEFVFDYPEDIVRGLTFEENSATQWDEEKFQEMMDEIMPGIHAEDEAELDEIARQALEEVDRMNAIEGDLKALQKWVESKGFKPGEHNLNVGDEGIGYVTLDLVWTYGLKGLQGGFTKPVGVRIGASAEELKPAEGYGYTCFASVEEFKEYVRKKYGEK